MLLFKDVRKKKEFSHIHFFSDIILYVRGVKTGIKIEHGIRASL